MSQSKGWRSHTNLICFHTIYQRMDESRKGYKNILVENGLGGLKLGSARVSVKCVGRKEERMKGLHLVIGVLVRWFWLLSNSPFIQLETYVTQGQEYGELCECILNRIDRTRTSISISLVSFFSLPNLGLRTMFGSYSCSHRLRMLFFEHFTEHR